ncbi:MAG: CHAT domain-containing protein [Gammaproteobacteria bacterium]
MKPCAFVAVLAAFAGLLITAIRPVPALAATSTPLGQSRCMQSFEPASRLLDRTVTLPGNGETRIDVQLSGRSDTLVYAAENGLDVEVEARDGTGAVIATADNPVARSGVQRLWLAVGGRAPTVLIVRGREHPGVSGSVRVLVVAVSEMRDGGSCASIEKSAAAADATYASARAATGGTAPASGSSPRAALESSATQYESAANQYEKVAAAFGAAGRLADRGDAQLAIATLDYYNRSEWAPAAKWAEQAADTLQKADDAYGRARARAVLASAWLEIATKSSSAGKSTATPADSRSQLDRARSVLTKLEGFHAARNEAYDGALQTNNLGLSYLYEARFEPALSYFNRANQEFERLHETQRVAVAQLNIALCEWGLGHLSAALPRFDRALSLMTPQPYPDLYLATLNNSALAYWAAGRFDESLRQHSQALEVAARLQMDRARGRTYYGMGVTYYSIGDRDLAARFLRSALEILTGDVDARGRVAALRALAVIEHETGAYSQASAHNSEALALATPPSARSRILLRLAADYAAQGDSSAAMSMLTPLVSFAPNGDALVQAMARAQRAKLLHAAGDLGGARRDAEAAITALRTFEAVTDEFDARLELARIERDAGNDDKALAAITRALNLTEEITTQTANPEFRASIAQSVRPALDLRVDLLWRRYERLAADRGSDAARAVALESLRTADDSRAVSFEQLRAQRLKDDADPRLAELQRSVGQLYRDIAERRFQLSTREDRAGSNSDRARTLREDIARLRAQIGVANAELAARAAPRLRGAKFAHLSGLDSVLGAPATSAFVEYWVGASNTYAWAISRGQVTWYRLASSDQVERAARGLHEAMRSYATTPARDRLDLSADLYRLAVAPLRPALQGATRLTIVPDGPLHYVPFVALRDAASADRPYVAQAFGIAFAPALRLMSPRKAPQPASWTDSRMLLVADPVYGADDPRLQRTARARPSDTDRLRDILRMRGADVDPSKLERLVSSARESERIRALPGLGRVDVLEGLDATRANVLAHDLAAYRFIHIASHGIIDSEIPQLSALILGAWDRDGRVTDQYVRAGDLMNRTFDAEVVVLSACDTALGREFSGEGLIGLRYAALARGARSVVGSLWPVSDAIAADLMTDMYRNITADGQPVELALSLAIRSALARTPSLDPALWGPFAVYVAND